MYSGFNRKSVLLCLSLLVPGCLAEDPASFRTVDGLLPGHWVQVPEEPDVPAPPTIDFNPDQSFSATSSAVPGALVANYHGGFWQAEGVIGFRGTGAIAGIHVHFVLFHIQEAPELTLTMTEIADAFIAETVGVEDIGSLSKDGVQSALRRLDGLPIPDTALGLSWDYLK